nr:serine/threonine-protein kinase 11-interacting protein-like [Onthophagus taurus]
MAIPGDIQILATLLRSEGDKILANKCKLTLSTDLVDELNDLFNNESSLTSSFHVLNNTLTEINRDLTFLHDFVQQSKSLKLSLGKPRDLQSDNIDISKFKSLRLLELHRINVNNIIGISNLRGKLQHLVCERSLNSLRDIFERCGADDSDGSNWYELREAVLNHNGIKCIDDSLKYLPMLTTLDLSHNSIKNCDELSGLSSLKHLNLSFNQLQKVPVFSRPICSRLQMLVLRCNFIEDIQSVSKLVNLTQLDLLENCLLEHNNLIPLSYLVALQWLNLTGNPLSYHPHHRINTVKYLHSNTSSVKFILDDDVLSSYEQQNVGSLHPKCLYKQVEQPSEPQENLERSIRVRSAIINENKSDDEDNFEKITVSVSVEVPKINSEPKENLNSIPKDYIKSLYGKTGFTPLDFSTQSGSAPSSSTPLQDYITDEMAKVKENIEETSQYVTASETINELNDLKDLKDNEVVEEESGVYDDPEETEKLSDDDFESGDSNIFLVNIKGGQSDVFAIIGKNNLVERNAITSKVLSRISLDSIILCNKTTLDEIEYVYIEFETFRSNNNRFYLIENVEERERFFGRIKILVDARPASESLEIFSCLKCSTQFGVEEQNTVHKDTIVCPACGSNLVFEENNS